MEIIDPLAQKLLSFGIMFFIASQIGLPFLKSTFGGAIIGRDHSKDNDTFLILPVLYYLCFLSAIGHILDLKFHITPIFLIAGIIIGLIFGLYQTLKNIDKNIFRL